MKLLIVSLTIIMLMSGCATVPKLHEAAAIGDTNLMATELAKNNDVNAKFQGFTPLILASGRGNLAAVKYLVEHGADINYVNSAHGSTALLDASVMSHYGVVKYLMSKGAIIEQRYINSAPIMEQYRGKNALDIAMMKGDQEMISILTKKAVSDNAAPKESILKQNKPSDWR